MSEALKPLIGWAELGLVVWGIWEVRGAYKDLRARWTRRRS